MVGVTSESDYPWNVMVCSRCENTWIQPDDPDAAAVHFRAQNTLTCPICGRERQPTKFKTLKAFETKVGAAEFRSRYLADRAGELEAYVEQGHYSDQADEVERRHPDPGYDPGVSTGTADELVADYFQDSTDRDGSLPEPGDDSRHGPAVKFETLAESRLEEWSSFTTAQFADDAPTDRELVTLQDHVDSYYHHPDGLDDPTLPSYDDVDTQPAPDRGSIRVTPTPPNQQQLQTVRATVKPTVSDWLPDALDAVSSQLADGVEAIDPGDVSDSTLASTLVTKYGVTGARTGYADAAVAYARRYHGLDVDDLDVREEVADYHRQMQDWLRSVLTNIGAGHNPLGISHDDLERSVVPILQAADYTPEFVFAFDAGAWLDSDRRSQRGKTLTAIRQIAKAADVTIVTSPRVFRKLRSSHPDFVDRVTQIDIPDRANTPGGAGRTATDPMAIYTDLETMDKRQGKLQILAHVERNPDATLADLYGDTTIDLADSSVRAYVTDLVDDHGYLAVDPSGTKSYSLTDAGELACSMLTDDLRVTHPDQKTVFASIEDPAGSETGAVTGTPTLSTSVVYGADDGSGLEERRPTAEERLAATGDADEDGYVQLLPKHRGSAWPLHARVAASDARDGVNLQDYPVERWEDLRVTYVSCLDDRMVTSTTYTGAATTLVRLATALLDESVWNLILTESAIGTELENVFDALDGHVRDLMVRAAQIGWLSEDEEEYDDYRSRMGAVRTVLLDNLGQIDDLDDEQERQLMRDAHGALQSATALCDAIGIDLTVDLRIPETDRLKEPEFYRFLAECVPRHASYGPHSVQRHTFEHDEEKRKRAMGVDVDPSDPTASLRASWVVSGSNITNHESEIRQAIRSRDQDRIDDDHAPNIEIPIAVTDVSEYAGMRYAVEFFLDRKGYRTGDENEAIRRTIRLFQAFAPTPYDVADALTTLASNDRPTGVSVGDVEYALSNLPADRLAPTLPDTVGAILKVLLEADEPLGRSEIVDRIDYSDTSYDKRIDELAAFDFVERVDGSKWRARIAPWYVPETDAEKPGFEESFVSVSGATLESVVFDAIDRLGYDLDSPGLLDAFGDPPDRDALIDAVGTWIEPWLDVVETFLGPQLPRYSDHNPDAVQRLEGTNTIYLGEPPAQSTLDEMGTGNRLSAH